MNTVKAIFNINKKDKKEQESQQPPTFNLQENGYMVTNRNRRLEPIARILLIGVYDDNNIWSNLRGMRYLVQQIWEFTLSFNNIYWNQFIQTDEKCLMMQKFVKFPKRKNININMMPFIMSDEFKKSKLPNYLGPYWPMISQCIQNDSSQLKKIGFVTIQEGLVHAGRTQRRPGIHTENPGKIIFNGNKGAGRSEGKLIDDYWAVCWGGGAYTKYFPKDGIYMASSIDNSCVAWDCKIIRQNDREVLGHLGNIEHLRSCLPKHKKQMMRANYLYWLTDRTPHESLTVEKKVYRQFFRLVTHPVSVWYEMHSTKNPNGVKPSKKITKIIKESKFAKLNDNNDEK